MTVEPTKEQIEAAAKRLEALLPDINNGAVPYDVAVSLIMEAAKSKPDPTQLEEPKARLERST